MDGEGGEGVGVWAFIYVIKIYGRTRTGYNCGKG